MICSFLPATVPVSKSTSKVPGFVPPADVITGVCLPNLSSNTIPTSYFLPVLTVLVSYSPVAVFEPTPLCKRVCPVILIFLVN